MRSAELNGQNKGEMDHFHMDCSGPIERILRFPRNQYYGLERDYTHFDQVGHRLFSQFVLHLTAQRVSFRPV